MADSKITVAPNRTFQISVAFLCSKENEIVVKDASGKQLWSTNSSKDEARKWSHANTGSDPMNVIVTGYCRDEAGHPMRESKTHESYRAEHSLIVGYEEGEDDDYNDTVAAMGF